MGVQGGGLSMSGWRDPSDGSIHEDKSWAHVSADALSKPKPPPADRAAEAIAVLQAELETLRKQRAFDEICLEFAARVRSFANEVEYMVRGDNAG